MKHKHKDDNIEKGFTKEPEKDNWFKKTWNKVSSFFSNLFSGKAKDVSGESVIDSVGDFKINRQDRERSQRENSKKLQQEIDKKNEELEGKRELSEAALNKGGQSQRRESGEAHQEEKSKLEKINKSDSKEVIMKGYEGVLKASIARLQEQSKQSEVEKLNQREANRKNNQGEQVK